MRSARSYFYSVASRAHMMNLDDALVRAADRNEPEKMDDLLDAGASLHAQNDAPLTLASQYGYDSRTMDVARKWLAKERADAGLPSRGGLIIP